MADWRQNPPRKGYLYVATSDRLQEWALRNDRLYIFKIGFASYGARRLDYLNGRIRDRPEPRYPCLDFTDWRFVARWHFETRNAAEDMEGAIHEMFDKIFDRFERTELVKDRPSSNGETEIFRLRRKMFPEAVGNFGMSGSDTVVSRQAIAILEETIVDIVEGRARRTATLLASLPGAGWGDDDFEEPEVEGRDDRAEHYDELQTQLYDDLDAQARADEEGWPYQDGNDGH